MLTKKDVNHTRDLASLRLNLNHMERSLMVKVNIWLYKIFRERICDANTNSVGHLGTAMSIWPSSWLMLGMLNICAELITLQSYFKVHHTWLDVQFRKKCTSVLLDIISGGHCGVAQPWDWVKEIGEISHIYGAVGATVRTIAPYKTITIAMW